MYDAFLYVVANDGVDTASAYPYRGQVTFREIWESIVTLTIHSKGN